MFDAKKLKLAFDVGLGKKSDATVTFVEAQVDDRPAALVTVTRGDKTAQRVFTEADQASSKLAATIEAFCERVA